MATDVVAVMAPRSDGSLEEDTTNKNFISYLDHD